MAILKPFRALRPRAEIAKEVSCVPYDVVHEPEVRGYIARNKLSFLRITRSEADFPPGSEPETDEVFERARLNLEAFVNENLYSLDPEEAFYIYQLESAGHTQTGVVGCASLDEYEQGVIKKHENVRPDKVEDRTRHLLEVKAQTGLIFLTFRNTDAIRSLVADAVETKPIYQFVCHEQITHTVWRVADTAVWQQAFAEIPAFYIADGHHRVESALNARNLLRSQNPNHTGDEEYNFVVAGLFPAEDLRILPYNRVVRGLNGLSEDGFLERLRGSFNVTLTGEKAPRQKGHFHMYLGSKWYELSSRVPLSEGAGPVQCLDVSILQDQLLRPILGINDPRTDEHIGFVGGARGVEELEACVNDGSWTVAFSMFATTMEDLLAVSDMGEIMPPKSTWFEPKLKDGLLVHMIDNG